MKKNQICLILLIVITFSVDIFANTGASFLDIGTSARSAGMGEAFCAVKNDISGMTYNPAGLATLSNLNVFAQHTEWVADSKHDSVSFAMPVKTGTLGANIVVLSQGDIEGRDEAGNKTGSFSAYDAAVTVSYSRKLSALFSGGINLKVIHQSIDQSGADGLAVDLGTQYSFRELPLSLGLAINNLGPRMKFLSEGYDLPLSVSLGAGYNFGFLTVAAELKQEVYSSQTGISIGTEYLPVSTLALRAGYLLPLIASKGQDISGNEIKSLSGAGVGMGFKLFGTKADYAFVPYGELGSAHRLSFSFGF